MNAQAMRFSLWCDFRAAPGRLPSAEFYRETMDAIVYAENLGFDGIWVSEHHGIEDAYLPAPFTVLGAIAARTSRMRLGTNILLLPLWPVRLVAEDSAVVDLLSNGRFTLGLGLGYVEHEFAAFGVPRSHRRQRMEAGIEYLRRAFDGQPVGDGPAGKPLPVTPLPAQGVRLPIYLGGEAEPALERVARLADGFLAAVNLAPLEELPTLWSALEPKLRANGRHPQTFPVVAGTHLWVSDHAERDWNEFLAPAIAHQMAVYERIGTDSDQPTPNPAGPEAYDRANFLVGAPDEVVAMLRALQATAPVNEICFWYRLPGVPHEAAIANLDRLARDVLPLVREPGT